MSSWCVRESERDMWAVREDCSRCTAVPQRWISFPLYLSLTVRNRAGCVLSTSCSSTSLSSALSGSRFSKALSFSTASATHYCLFASLLLLCNPLPLVMAFSAPLSALLLCFFYPSNIIFLHAFSPAPLNLSAKLFLLSFLPLCTAFSVTFCFSPFLSPFRSAIGRYN